jgi:hypothetical protein
MGQNLSLSPSIWQSPECFVRNKRRGISVSWIGGCDEKLKVCEKPAAGSSAPNDLQARHALESVPVPVKILITCLVLFEVLSYGS